MKRIAVVVGFALLVAGMLPIMPASGHVHRKVKVSMSTVRPCCTTGYGSLKSTWLVTNLKKRRGHISCSGAAYSNKHSSFFEPVGFNHVRVPARTTVRFTNKSSVYWEWAYNYSEKFPTEVRHCHFD